MKPRWNFKTRIVSEGRKKSLFPRFENIYGIFLFAFLLTLNLTLKGQGTAPSTTPDGKIYIETILDCFSRNYVLPEIVPDLKDSLCRYQINGKYSESENIENLLFQLSEDIRRLTGDKHFRLNYIGKSEREAGEYSHSLLSPSLEDRKNNNYGFRKVEWLPGNIGYLRFDVFSDPLYAGERLVSAISYLNNCDAIILDLRYNGGGEEKMVKFLAGYFFEEPTLLNQMYFPRQDSLWLSWSSAFVPGKRLVDKNLYILTSRSTASAAEAFSYSLQNLRRATIIGEITSGAAHWVNYFYYPELNMEIKLPIARPINPITNTNWEKKGVIPDIKIAESLAFEAAYLNALETIVAKLDDEAQKSDLEWYITIMKVKGEKAWNIRPEEYAGKYENLSFIIKNGNLWWSGGDGEEYMIIPLSKDNFVFTDTEDYLIRFIRNEKGDVVAYQFLVRWRKDNPVYKKLE
jgi:retinol-binding protein 3